VAGWPDNADLRLNFAPALADAGDNQRAFDQLDAAAGLRPGEPTAYLVFRKLLLQESRPADALKAYERALKAGRYCAAFS
jgi:tetratricopeptide (TPR) repeat protein